MKRTKNFVSVVLAALGLTEFHKNDEGKAMITDEEKKTLGTLGFNDAFLEAFEAELNEPDDEPETPADQAKQNATYVAVIQQTTKQLAALEQEVRDLKAQAVKEKADYSAQISEKENRIANLTKQVATLSELPDVLGNEILPNVDKTPTMKLNWKDEKQLGGMQGEFFALDRPYNQRARAAMLAQQNIMVMAATPSPADFSRLREDLGAFYRTPWRERLQSFLVELPSITALFPTESGHQDLDTLVNIWFGEFSQADNTIVSDFDKVKKGSYEFNHETLRMYGVMFVHEFKDLKQIEKLWIGYLNREGSNPVKLSFIEFLLVEISKALHNERELRRVNGVRVNPVANEPGSAMAASDGIYEYLRKKIEGHIDFTPDGGTTGRTVYQIKPFDLPGITPGNIGEVFYKGTSMVPSRYRDTGKVVLYVPSFMMPWYHKYNETHYGQNIDYKSNINYVKEYPNVRIEAIPNADNHFRIFWTIEGNIKTYDQIAGEMLNFSLEQQDWRLKAWSNWKEGLAAEAVGFKYTDPAEMDGSRQLIWANNQDLPDTYFVAAKPNTNPSALLHSSIETVANTGTFTITDITDAPVGKVITLKCGVDGDNGVKIAKDGVFSLLTAAWTPARGEVIKLMKREDGKFIEISRGESIATDTFEFAADATTPSVAGATVFVTNENTKATAITNLSDAEAGVIYTIYGAGSDNASTIKNGGNFELSADITLSAGHFIRLVKGAGGKFYEIARG